MLKSIVTLTLMGATFSAGAVLPPSASTCTCRAQEQASAALPATKELVAKFTKASGGAENLQAVKTSIVEGTVKIPSLNFEGEIKILQSAPDHMRMSINLGPNGTQEQGYNGKVAWTVGPGGAQVLEGAMEAQIKLQSRMEGFAAIDEYFDSLETKALVTFEGEDAYEVICKKEGLADRTIYFAKESGLVLGTTATEEVPPFGEMKVTTVFSNYEKVGDVVLCKQMEMRLPGMKQIIEFEKIQLNQELPKDWEKLPKAISSQLR